MLTELNECIRFSSRDLSPTSGVEFVRDQALIPKEFEPITFEIASKRIHFESVLRLTLNSKSKIFLS